MALTPRQGCLALVVVLAWSWTEDELASKADSGDADKCRHFVEDRLVHRLLLPTPQERRCLRQADWVGLHLKWTLVDDQLAELTP